MSFYDVTAFVEGAVSDVAASKRVLSDYIILIRDDSGEFAFANPGVIPATSVISLPLGKALKLLDSEKKAIKDIREANEIDDDNSLDGYLEEIFADRFADSGSDPDDFSEWLFEEVPCITTLDLFTKIVDGVITISGTIGATGGLFFGDTAVFPEIFIEVCEKYQFVHGIVNPSLERVFRKISFELKAQSVGEFNFDRIEDLVGSTVFGTLMDAETPIVTVPVTQALEGFSYQIEIRSGSKILDVDFKFKKPDNKRVSADNVTRLQASMREGDYEIWCGFDAIELKRKLNEWCRDARSKSLDATKLNHANDSMTSTIESPVSNVGTSETPDSLNFTFENDFDAFAIHWFDKTGVNYRKFMQIGGAQAYLELSHAWLTQCFKGADQRRDFSLNLVSAFEKFFSMDWNERSAIYSYFLNATLGDSGVNPVRDYRAACERATADVIVSSTELKQLRTAAGRVVRRAEKYFYPLYVNSDIHKMLQTISSEMEFEAFLKFMLAGIYLDILDMDKAFQIFQDPLVRKLGAELDITVFFTLTKRLLAIGWRDEAVSVAEFAINYALADKGALPFIIGEAEKLRKSIVDGRIPTLRPSHPLQFENIKRLSRR